MKISIVGMGHVGAATAHALVSAGLAEDLVLVSRHARKAEGEAMDLDHAGTMLSDVCQVRGGGVELSEASDLVVLAHSVPTEKPGRKLLAEGNAKLFRETVPQYAELSPDAIFLILSNPVDALTWLTLELTNLPASRVIGSGTLIDSARLRTLLSDLHGIHPDDLRIYVLGEHGDQQFPAVSLGSTGGERFEHPDKVQQLFEDARQVAWEVFDRKGYTNFAIAQAAVLVARSVLHNERRTLPVTTKIDGYLGETGVCLSLPCVLGRQGIERVMHPNLTPEEQAAFHAAAESVRETIALMG